MKSKYIKMDVNGHIHLLKEMEITRDISFSEPSYMGTGMCLVGILRKGETIAAFEKRMNIAKVKIQKDAERIKFPDKGGRKENV